MYYAVVATLMFAFPALSIGLELMRSGAPFGVVVVAKWFVFWSVGWLLLLAGGRQILQPAYTARVILGLKSDEALVLVRELGFANVATGVLGIASLWVPSWQLAGALVGGLFYAFAGAGHVAQAHRNRIENVAMISDLFAAAVLLGVCVGAML